MEALPKVDTGVYVNKKPRIQSQLWMMPEIISCQQGEGWWLEDMAEGLI